MSFQTMKKVVSKATTIWNSLISVPDEAVALLEWTEIINEMRLKQ